MKLVRKVRDDADLDIDMGPPEKGDRFASTYPGVWMYLSLRKYEDGTSREPSSLTVFTEMGKCKLCLADKDAGRVCFVSGRSVEDALHSLEKQLQSDSADWRAQKRLPRK